MHADREAEELVDAPHPLGVALGEVVVDGDDVHALAGERIEVDRQRGDQRLAFAGLHLGDLALVQHHAADQLHVEMPLAERALGGLADGGEGRHQQVVERVPIGELLAERVGAGPQLGVGQALELRLEHVDGLDRGAIGLEPAIVRGAEHLGRNRADGQHALDPHIILVSGPILDPGPCADIAKAPAAPSRKADIEPEWGSARKPRSRCRKLSGPARVRALRLAGEGPDQAGSAEPN